ncbi:MAG: heme exporter protein CcmB [Hyphomicrobiaceae bacterium]
MRALGALLVRDLKLAAREGGALGTALGFYLIVVALMPLSLGPDLALVSRIAGGILWVALLLSALLSLPRVFETDLEDGTLEAMATARMPLELVTAVKALAHWISTSLPLTLMAPLLGMMLNLEISAYPALLATMLAGTPAISFIGSIGAALTLRSRRGGLLIALVVLPLYIPTLIFGISAMEARVLDTGGFGPSFLILSAISLASLVLGPLAAALAIRMQLG